MQVKVNIQYLDLLNLIRQLPIRELNRLKQDIKSIRGTNTAATTRISSLRGRVSKQNEQDVDAQIFNLRSE
ncbi:MAG: hypothetical protein AAF599_02960 [Bacteroidota bacterium]